MRPPAITTLCSVGDRARYARLCRGHTRRIIEKYTRVRTRTLEAYEQGLRAWPHDTLRLLAYAYAVPVKWLLDGRGDPPCKPRSYVDDKLDPEGETTLRRRMRDFPGWRQLDR